MEIVGTGEPLGTTPNYTSPDTSAMPHSAPIPPEHLLPRPHADHPPMLQEHRGATHVLDETLEVRGQHDDRRLVGERLQAPLGRLEEGPGTRADALVPPQDVGLAQRLHQAGYHQRDVAEAAAPALCAVAEATDRGRPRRH